MDTKNTPIAIGSDHAGYYLKESLIEDLRADGYQIQDFGTFSLESVDYPDIAREVAEAISSGRFERGILVCGTGIGISIAANKVKGIRATVCSDTFSARMSREHNNANIIAVGARVVGAGLALDIVKSFLETPFEYGSRHERRVDKINALDEC
ncbi:ribose 5-phosphate isomerase B [bacterium]|nr:ribose 5-phosphate isomerase B [bacterium]